jgi:hypothetical protein
MTRMTTLRGVSRIRVMVSKSDETPRYWANALARSSLALPSPVHPKTCITSVDILSDTACGTNLPSCPRSRPPFWSSLVLRASVSATR